MIELDRLYTQQEIDEPDLFNEGIEFGSLSPSTSEGLVDYPLTPPPSEDLIDYLSPPGTPQTPPSPLVGVYEPEDDGRIEGAANPGWEDKTMKFGKYKGETLLTVSQDIGYCEWMIKNCFHWNIDKDKYLRDMLYGYLVWKEETKMLYIPEIDNSQLIGCPDLSDINPLSIDAFPWLIEARPEFAPVSYTDVGKWLLFFELHDLAERWKQVKYFYRSGFLEGVFQIKCSTAQDNPRASDKSSGVIAICCCGSYEQDRIMAIGRDILELLDLGDKTIYYKTDEQSREGTRVNKKKNHIYRLSFKDNL